MPDIKYKNYFGEDVILKNANEVQYALADGSGNASFSFGKAIENVTIALDFSGGNQTVNAPEGMLAKSAIVLKPETLTPDNIKKGKTVAGIEGAYSGEGEAIFVPLNMADGDMVITPTGEKLFSSVTVKKPDSLIPENIAAGVEIAGVIGTHVGGGSGGDFNSADERLKYFICHINSEKKTITLYEILWAEVYAATGSYDVVVPDKIGGYDVIVANG